MDDNKSVRCKACDTLFATVWIEERGEHEELCWRCLTLAFAEGLSDEDEEIPGEIQDVFDEYARSAIPD